MGKINADWHSKNKMPKNPTKEQRLLWHAKHYKNCSCRQPSKELFEEIKKLILI